MAVNGIEIKKGQRWRRRNGSAVVIAQTGETLRGWKEEFKVLDDAGDAYTCTGRYTLGVRCHKHDLVELIVIGDDPVADAALDQLAASRKAPTSAPDLLEAAAGHMRDRAATYDKPEGERSMAQTVAIFNLHHGAALTEAQGWHFMQILKDVRLFTNVAQPHRDSCEDGVAYSALKAEALLKGGAQ